MYICVKQCLSLDPESNQSLGEMWRIKWNTFRQSIGYYADHLLKGYQNIPGLKKCILSSRLVIAYLPIWC